MHTLGIMNEKTIITSLVCPVMRCRSTRTQTKRPSLFSPMICTSHELKESAIVGDQKRGWLPNSYSRQVSVWIEVGNRGRLTPLNDPEFVVIENATDP